MSYKDKGIRLLVVLLAVALLTVGCRRHAVPTEVVTDSVAESIVETAPEATPDTQTEAMLREKGLVDVQELDPSIQVHLVYATADNFMGQVLYTDLHKAFLLPQVAEKIARAQQLLKAEHPDLTLLVLDAARPLTVQRRMFHVVAGTPLNIYVSNPKKRPGMHNYGAAVDITIADSSGEMVDMGCDFDHFGQEAHINNEKQLVAEGKISQQAYENRRLLRRLMKEVGMIPLWSEWWHFNLMSRERAARELEPLDW